MKTVLKELLTLFVGLGALGIFVAVISFTPEVVFEIVGKTFIIAAIAVAAWVIGKIVLLMVPTKKGGADVQPR